MDVVAQFALEMMLHCERQISVWLVASRLQTDEVFLEAQIQNITTSPMFMEKVSLEPSMMYNVTELNTVAATDDGG